MEAVGQWRCTQLPVVMDFPLAVVPTFLNVIARMGLCVVNRFASFGPLSRSAPSSPISKNDANCQRSVLGLEGHAMCK